MINKEYLADIKINFTGSAEDIKHLSNINKYKAVISILDEIEEKMKNNIVDFKGIREFFSSKIKEIFYDKIIKVEIGTEREKGQEQFLKDKDWYIFNANYGTSEEKACVEFIDRLIKEELKKNYKEIFFIRNELHFVIYNFSDGQAFAPDYILFLKKDNGEEIVYQIFIEPKGKHLQKIDEWKEKLLLEIRELFDSKDVIKFIETRKYKVTGVPFYNKLDENIFKEELLKVVPS